MENLFISVVYTLKNEGDREKAVKEMNDSGVLDAIRKENGCYIYQYYYSAENERTLVLYEKWESAEHQKIHMTQPHMQTAMAIMNKYVESVKVYKLDIGNF